ncbi:MAG TPA: T9SS type A sorting domain-containing protein [Niastella sp.]
MKKCTLFFMAVLFLASAYASNEHLVAVSTSGTTQGPIVMLNPCTNIPFQVTYSIPSGFNAVSRFDWYINNVFYTSTTSTTGGYGATTIPLNAPTARVVCKVVYANGSTLSAPAASNEVILEAKLNPYTLSGPSVVDLGNQTVTYTLNKHTGNDYYVLNSGSFTINWEFPSGWSLISTNGGTATFLTDNYSGGVVKAVITITGCGYQEACTLINPTVSRNYPPVSFTDPYGGNVCYSNPTGTFAINPQPAAVSYTYTIHPSYGSDISGATFAGSGTQTLTTTDASATINFNTSSNLVIDLGVKANYGNGVSGPETKKTIGFLVPLEWPSQNISVEYHLGGSGYPCSGWIQVEAPWVSGATYYYYLDGFMVDQGQGMNITGFGYNGESVLSVVAWNSCSSAGTIYKDLSCSGGMAMVKASDASISVYPNPAINDVTLTVKESGNSSTAKADKGLKEIKEVKLLDKFGAVKKITKYPAGTKNVRLSLGTLPSDIYVLEISDGVNKVIKRVSKSK